MKKEYMTPEVELQKFTCTDSVITTSDGGIDDGDVEIEF